MGLEHQCKARSPGPLILTPVILQKCCSQPQLYQHLDVDLVDLSPDLWTDFPPWPQTCPVTVNLPDDWDSGLTTSPALWSALLLDSEVVDRMGQAVALQCMQLWDYRAMCVDASRIASNHTKLVKFVESCRARFPITS